jgi:hypothetical protein
MRQFMMCAVFMCVAAGTASAQSQISGVRHFVEGGVIADIDGNAYTDDATTAPGGVFGLGTSLPRHWTVRFEATRPGWHESTYRYAGQLSGSNTLTYSGVEQHRIETYAVLFGKDVALSPRATFTVLGGLSAARHVDHYVETTEMTRAGVVTTTSNSNQPSELISTLAVGAEVAIAVTPRVAIVPGFRAHAPLGYESGFNMWRPGVNVRWRF